ncbi:MAG: gliding motility-associated C-terminal domain-containing protein, partial [Saprospiraceae bacterium]|nr:gliding motility-associated C-terminal domain-containing protein [Saprospiraceae bacterium]
LCGADRDTIVVDISGSSPLPQLGPDTTLCAGNSLALMSDADDITSIEWQDGSDTPFFLVTVPGLYILSESNRCGDAVDSILVTYIDPPAPFDLGPDTTLCPGEFFIISAPATLYALQWQDGSSQPEMVADEAITYSLEISNACGVVSDNLIVDIDQDTPVLHPDAQQDWCPGDIITFDVTQSFAAMYVWSTGETTPSITVSTPGVYSVEVNTLCASSTQELEVVPSQNCGENNEIFIPNVFSPNGDNVNDVFTIYSGSDLVIANSKGTIYDRWGNLVYSSNALPFTWDGFFNGDIMMPGVYAYVITVSYMVNGQEFEKVFSGDVTLIR